MREDDSSVRSNALIGRGIDDIVEQLPELEDIGEAVGDVVVGLAESSPLARRIADFLHGTWLGHPLHPVFTDATIGAWVYSAFFDIASMISGSRKTEDAADTLVAVGSAMAVPTAIMGLTDYSRIPNHAVKHGALHGILNLTSFALYLLSFGARRKGARGLGISLSAAGLGVATISAWLGGDMVYRQRVGVNHAVDTMQPKDWMAVMPAAALSDGDALRIDLAGAPILLTRQNGEIYAIGAVCSHAGGPLEQGDFEDTCVTCPWHGSVFSLEDGSVVHGPATSKEPCFEVRVVGGQIELRAAARDFVENPDLDSSGDDIGNW
jgi:nitrite reductase/ring-hydroxylating ferredoxin subunit